MNTFMTALLNTMMGMGTVFLVLIFISLIISLFIHIPALERKLASFKENMFSRKNRTESVPDAPKPKRPVLEPEGEEELVDDGELVAVIMAAIAASSGGAVSADRLVVRSIRRVKKRR